MTHASWLLAASTLSNWVSMPAVLVTCYAELTVFFHIGGCSQC